MSKARFKERDFHSQKECPDQPLFEKNSYVLSNGYGYVYDCVHLAHHTLIRLTVAPPIFGSSPIEDVLVAPSYSIDPSNGDPKHTLGRLHYQAHKNHAITQL